MLGRDDIISTPLPPLDPDGSGTAPDWGRASPQDGDSAIPATNDLPEDIGTIEALPPLPVRYGEEGLPTPVRDLRARLMEIAASGEIEALRPYLETGTNATAISIAPIEGDPVEFLKAASGDGKGVEILAILLEILDAGHVQVEPGSENEIFVWPYFTQVPLEDLTPPQLVELFEIVTAGDYQGMLDSGAYDFYRVGISPAGRLEFFLAGD